MDLYTSADIPVASVLTAADGSYAFEGLLSGSYYTVFNATEAYGFSDPYIGADDEDIRRRTTITGRSAVIALTAEIIIVQ